VDDDHQLVVRIGRKLIELEPDSATRWATLACGHYRAGDFKAAEAVFGKAIELKTQLSAMDEFFLAMTLWQQGNKQEALRHYEAADKRPRTELTAPIRREAAELIGVKIPPATRPSG
jgi:tetratricopeptide (TPR) repeat protein